MQIEPQRFLAHPAGGIWCSGLIAFAERLSSLGTYYPDSDTNVFGYTDRLLDSNPVAVSNELTYTDCHT